MNFMREFYEKQGGKTMSRRIKFYEMDFLKNIILKEQGKRE